MAGRWTLFDIAGNSLNIDDKTFKFMEAEFKIEQDIIERSSQDGADLIGLTRVKSRSLPFEFVMYDTNEQNFRTRLNTYMMWFRNAVYLYDTINKLRADISLDTPTIKYTTGSFNHVCDCTIEFKMLNPFWEGEEITEQLSSISSGMITINNNGYATTPPILYITALVPTTKFSIIINENRDGIAIQDLQFGTQGLNYYIIDCKEGTCELNSTDRSENIRNGTNYFNLILGVNTLLVSSNGDIDIIVKYRERFWL
jgi:hypothetical protein